jgi:ABC-type antimicrobial peptide transport system permease subunit
MKKSFIAVVLGVAALVSTGALAEPLEWGITPSSPDGSNLPFIVVDPFGKVIRSSFTDSEFSVMREMIRKQATQISELESKIQALEKKRK